MIGAALSMFVLLFLLGLIVVGANADRARAGWRDFTRDLR